MSCFFGNYKSDQAASKTNKQLLKTTGISPLHLKFKLRLFSDACKLNMLLYKARLKNTCLYWKCELIRKTPEPVNKQR